MKLLNVIAWIFVALGGINLGLIGFFDYDLVWVITGYTEMITRIIYGIVGLSTLYLVITMMMGGRRSTVQVN